VRSILGKVFFPLQNTCKYMWGFMFNRKSTIYEMSWPKTLIELGTSIVSISPYGGPIGMNLYLFCVCSRSHYQGLFDY